MKYILVVMTLLSVGCSEFKSKKTAAPTPAPVPPAIELLQGTWSACQSSSSASQQVKFTFTGTVLSEKISEWDQPGCTGVETVHIQFNAAVTVETAAGESVHFAGGTDITLVPDIDLFGCGTGAEAYTFIKFLDSTYTSFNPADGQPSCDPEDRGTALQPLLTFIKQ